MQPEELRELIKLSRSPWRFLTTYVRTLDPMRGISDFPEYSYLKDLIGVARRERFLLVPKSRQMMVTWTMTGYILWQMLFRGPGVFLFLSRNERCAEELINRARFMLDHLPDFLRPKLTANSRQEIAFGLIGSNLLSIPATPDGPRMYSPNAVFWDEMAFTPYDRQIWSALQPALMSGGSFAGVSSSGGAVNFFAESVQQPATQTNHNSSLFHIHRIHYSMHPERGDADWKLIAGMGLSESQWQREQEISFDAQDDLVYCEFDPAAHLLSEEWRVREGWDLYRSIDFGYRKPFVLWIQRTPGGEYIVIDEWAGKNATTSAMLEAIRKIDAVHGIGESDVNWTSCDPAGAAMQDSGLSPVDLLRQEGIKLRYRSSRILPGIESMKAALRDVRGRTRLRISPRCRKLIADIARYRWAPGREDPVKDGDCDHSLDALRYFFVNLNTHDEQFEIVPRVGSTLQTFV